MENSEFFFNETGIALKIGATLVGNLITKDSNPKNLLMIKHSSLAKLHEEPSTFIHNSNPYAKLIPGPDAGHLTESQFHKIPGTSPPKLTESQFNNHSQIPFNMVVSHWFPEDESQISIAPRDIGISDLHWMGAESLPPKPRSTYSTTNFADWNQDAVKRLQSLNLSRKIKQLKQCINILSS